MNYLPVLVWLFISLSLPSCQTRTPDHQTSVPTSSDEESDSDEEEEQVDGYEDGIYCARVEYYYSNTGTHSVYTLEVEVEDNEVVKIYWPNGGWLDTDLFISTDISDGMASFTSDQGVDYRVQLQGKQGECSLSGNAWSEDDLLEYEERLKRREEKEEEKQRLEEEEFYRSLEEDEEDWNDPFKENY